MRTVANLLLKTYRCLFSPLVHQMLFWPGGCRFNPTCSAYGLEAIRQYGLAGGLMFLSKRLWRCRAGMAFGYDPLLSPPIKRANLK